jgi:LCP family protein required for cell wall assembly
MDYPTRSDGKQPPRPAEREAHVVPRSPRVPPPPTPRQPPPPATGSRSSASPGSAPSYAAPPPPRASEDRSASTARERSRKRRRNRPRGGEWALFVIALTLLSVVVLSSLIFAVVLRTNANGVEMMTTAVAVLPTPVAAQRILSGEVSTLNVGDQVTLDDGRSVVLQPWNGGSRLTVLVMGLDRRPGEEGLAYRTDTMMLISLDRDTNSLGILSIPRDLYVEVPGYGQLQRINSAMVLGELQQPNYGPTLAMQTVQYNFGIRVHNFIAMDFQAVTDIVDVLGGVDLEVPYDIVDYEYPDMNFGYDPLILRAGLQHLDGATALKFARTRHGDNDFERARRQQLVLYALRDRVLNLNMLPQLVVQSPSLLGALADNVYTGLTLDQIIQIAFTLKDVPTDQIRQGVVDNSYTMPYTTTEGAQVLVPRREQLARLLTDTFGPTYGQ